MRVQLDAQEQAILVWQEGDYLEIVPGKITVTATHRENDQVRPDQSYVVLTFFFESQGSEWGEMEWCINAGSEIPNGPALLILYRRASTANAFGIVSMTNRAWTHTVPLETLSLYKSSARQRRSTGTLLRTLGCGFVLVCLSCVGHFVEAVGASLVVLIGLLLIASIFPSFRKAAARWFGTDKSVPSTYYLAPAARALMHRLAKDADRFWPGSQGESGKL